MDFKMFVDTECYKNPSIEKKSERNIYQETWKLSFRFSFVYFRLERTYFHGNKKVL